MEISLSYIISLNTHWSPDSAPLLLAPLVHTIVFLIFISTHAHTVTDSNRYTGKWIYGLTWSKPFITFCLSCFVLVFTGSKQNNKYPFRSKVWFSLTGSHKPSETNDCDNMFWKKNGSLTHLNVLAENCKCIWHSRLIIKGFTKSKSSLFPGHKPRP